MTTALSPFSAAYVDDRLQYSSAQSGAHTPAYSSSSSDAGSSSFHPMTPKEAAIEVDSLKSDLHSQNGMQAHTEQQAQASTSVKILILGAGPTGLGAAHQLHLKQSDDWLLVDSYNRPGGMAITEEDEQGFKWDLGGHVIHSHYDAFDKAIAMHKDWVQPSRGGWVRVQEQWCPTPIQQSLGNLRNGKQILKELAKTAEPDVAIEEAKNLAEYYRNRFGPTLNDTFFAPFNRKQWAADLRELDYTWTSLRAGSKQANVPEATQALIKLEKPLDTSSFPYPRLGTGSLWQSIAAQLPASKQRYSTTVERLDIHARKAYLSNGEVVSYERLISSIPMNRLLEMIADQRPDLAALVPQLKHSSTTAVGLGFSGPLPAVLEGKSWVFSADPEVSFHRATVVTNFSSALSNDGRSAELRWSIMFETSSSEFRPVATDKESLVADHLAELRRWGAISEDTKPLSVWYKHLHMGYPLPFLGRDKLLSSAAFTIHPELEKHGILSRGRFGGWRYESSNQDYAFVQGVEAVDILTNTDAAETVYWPTRPDKVQLPLIKV